MFVVGSGLVLPDARGTGVPGADGIVEMIRSRAAEDGRLHELDSHLRKRGPGHRYQRAFDWVFHSCPMDTPDDIIRTAVLRALKDPALAATFHDLPPDRLPEKGRSLEQKVDAWALSPGVVALGEILAAGHRGFESIFTTNFDPLIEVAVSLANGRFLSLFVGIDGDINRTSHDGALIVHLNGYWRQRNTLHTRMQLEARPSLRHSLHTFVEDAGGPAHKLIVVVGYGGWPDQVTGALTSIDHPSTALLWTFYGTGAQTVKDQQDLLATLQSNIRAGRTALYANVDANEFFPELRNCLRGAP